MRNTKTLFALLFVATAGGGMLYAQEGDKQPPPPDEQAGDDQAGDDQAGDDQAGDGQAGDDLPEATISGETEADLSPREMDAEADRMIDEMEGNQVRVLELQGAARKAKDVIKLNCVNESLLAVKQLLNIADEAENDLTESIAEGDRAEQIHDYTQVKLAHERSNAERDNAEGCIGEEIVFIGPTQVSTTGPDIPDDPTDDEDDPFTGSSLELERPAYASPWK